MEVGRASAVVKFEFLEDSCPSPFIPQNEILERFESAWKTFGFGFKTSEGESDTD